jgi:hemerythrin-like domain-containing protein
MDETFDASRRRFLRLTAIAGAGLLASPRIGVARPGEPAGKETEPEEEVTPAEDLMREHGVLKRVLLVYREAIRRIDAGEDLPPEALADAAGIIRRFIEEYHEKLEEDHLFPRFRKAGKLVDLVDILARQHEAGRILTGRILQLASARALKSPDDRKKLSGDLGLFVRMYEPHEAREDTVLFPALRKVIGPREYDALGEDFEKKEHELFGQEGFEKMVDRVAGIEKALGILDLSRFTPEL